MCRGIDIPDSVLICRRDRHSVGLALSQTAPQMRVQVLLKHPATNEPMPANLEVRDDRWNPGAETG
jgi:hypothetical protein